MSKVLCPWHDDSSPSLEIYEEHCHCFVCGKHATHAELEKVLGGKVKSYPFRKSGMSGFKENIARTIERINTLSTLEIRGFQLPYDRMGYYLVWPNGKYYIKRLFREAGGSKYYAPIGHKRPLFIPADLTRGTPLVIIEGEFNAKAASLACSGKYSIVSPGSAPNLKSPDLAEIASVFTQVVLIVDRDATGVLAAGDFQQKMLTTKRRIVIIPLEKDFNDLLVEHGSSTVLQTLEDAIKKL